MSKILTVFRATGNQGGSVIETVLFESILSKEFKIMGITRDDSKPAAQALAAKGVEAVTADMTAKASLAAVAKGSDTVFLVTTPDFMSGGGTQEQIHGKYVADVASEAGVKHLIYSSLLHVTETTNGRLKHVVHFDDKAEVERYIRSKGTKTLSSGNCRYSNETYKSFIPGPLGDEMLENHLFIEEPGYYAGAELKESLDLLASVRLKPTS